MALSGDHIEVRLGNSGGTLQNMSTDILSVDIPLTYDQFDVTGFSDAVHKFITGQLKAPVTLRGYLTTTATTGTHTVIQPALTNGTKMGLDVRVGINAAPVTGNPKFTGDFYISSYVPTLSTGGAITFTATLTPAVGTGTGTPAWGTV